MKNITYKINTIPELEKIVNLYQALGWGHKDYPEMLQIAYANSEYIVCAYHQEELIAVGRAISDKSFTVYFPDLLVHPDWQRKGIGRQIMSMMLDKFQDFHNIVLTAEDERARSFYLMMGFKSQPFGMSVDNSFKEIKKF